MNLALARSVLRRFLTNGRLYAYARRSLLLAQFVARIPDDADFEFFRQMPRRSGLVVDIGANGGQSAIAFAICCSGVRILSFEPNPALWPELEFVKKVLRRRFEYCRFGLSDRDCEMELHVPTVGGLAITTRGSIRAEEAARQAETLARETARRPSVTVVAARFRRFDEFELRPDAIKIDVEGAELSVLRGMTGTLASCRPVLMLESNDQSDQCRDLLGGFGYEFFEYDAAQRRLRTLRRSARNWFAVPVNRGA